MTDWQPDNTVLGEFVVERELGGGGFGRVALVRNRRSGERYAAKRILVDDQVAQHRFLTEAQRWISLPEHPHLAACRFVRTVGDELVVFSEFVPGGSLADRIRTGHLYSAGHPAHTICRIAIEAAWGLDAVHAMALLHLDVKPANVLLTEDHHAKLADFGLSTGSRRDPAVALQREAVVDYILGDDPGLNEGLRTVAESILRQQLHGAADTSIRAVAEGHTLAYASPEQAEGEPLGRGADLWSWAVTVLEMFAGERTWPSGALADAVLERLVQRDDWRLTPPAGVVDLLRACFGAPAARPASAGEAADALGETAARTLGFRPEPAPPRPSPTTQLHERRTVGGGDWSDPKRWLHIAYRAAGLDPASAVAFWPTRLGTRKSQALADLQALAEARRVLDGIPDAPDIRAYRARIRGEIARIEFSLGNVAGGLAAMRAAVDLDVDDHRLQAVLLTELATALREAGQPEAACEAHDRAVTTAAGIGADAEARRIQATVLLAQANTLASRSAEPDRYDRALAAYEQAGDEKGAATVLAAKAATAQRASDGEAAAGLWDRADERLRALDTMGRADLVATRGRVAYNRAVCAAAPAEQLRHAQTCVDLLEPLVREQGWYELAGDLGRAWFQVGRAQERLDRPQQALEGYRAAGRALADAVVRDGRTGLSGELASAYDHESTLVRDLEDPRRGADVAARAVACWQRMAELDGPAAWTERLADARTKLAAALMDAGAVDAAREQLDQVLALIPERAADTAERSALVALAHRGHGVLLRRAGDPRGAYERYQRALDVLGDEPEPRREQTKVLILESMAAAFGDAGRLADAVSVTEQAVRLVESLVERGERGETELAGAYQRLANDRLRIGDCAGAAETAEKALAVYRKAIDAGRSDLVREAARLRAVYGTALHRVGDVEGAITAIASARSVFAEAGRTDEQMASIARGVDEQLAALRGLTALRRRQLRRWLDDAPARLTQVGQLSRAGHPRHASLLVEELIGDLLYLSREHPEEAVFRLLGEAGEQQGLVALFAHRDAASRTGFAVAVNAYGTLVDSGLTGYLEGLAKAFAGLAGVLAAFGDAEESARTIDELERRVAAVDPAGAAAWRARAEQTVAAMLRV